MLSFHSIGIGDKPWVDSLVKKENMDTADFAFGNMYIWDAEYDQQLALCGGRMVVLVQAGDENPFFAWPVGDGDVRPVLEEMRRYAEEKGFPFRICGVTDRYKEELEQACPDCFRFRLDEVFSDYVYSAEKLATLAGRKLHKKKNHCSAFERQYPDWRYEPMEERHFEECLGILKAWNTGREEDPTAIAEAAAIRCSFDHFRELELEGGVLYAGDRLAAFTVGEEIGRDTWLVHFEKADVSVNGSYAVINREYVRQILRNHPQTVKINREDDLGLEGLRQAKLSYYPEMLVNKYTAEWVGAPA